MPNICLTFHFCHRTFQDEQLLGKHKVGVSKIGVPQNGWSIMENPIKMDDLGVTPFLETPKYTRIFQNFVAAHSNEATKVCMSNYSLWLVCVISTMQHIWRPGPFCLTKISLLIRNDDKFHGLGSNKTLLGPISGLIRAYPWLK